MTQLLATQYRRYQTRYSATREHEQGAAVFAALSFDVAFIQNLLRLNHLGLCVKQL